MTFKVYNGKTFLGYSSEMTIVDESVNFDDFNNMSLFNKSYTVTFNIDMDQFINSLTAVGFSVETLTSLMPGLAGTLEKFDGGKPEILNQYKPMLNQMVKCPACDDSDTLEMVVMDLNDTHKWTREAIADWMDGLVAEGKINIDIESKDKDKA